MREIIATAMFVLFGGNQDMDNWVTLSGKWAARDGVLVCETAPAEIRSTFQSDFVIVSFEYRNSGKDANRIFIRSSPEDKAAGFPLSTGGINFSGRDSTPKKSLPNDEWITARIEAGPKGSRAVTTDASGAELSDDAVSRSRNPKTVWETIIGADPRVSPAHFTYTRPHQPIGSGFIRIQSTQAGLQIRNIRVEEPGFTPLLDGKTLKGWEPVGRVDSDKPNWVVENGILRCVHHKGEEWANWLRTLETYDDFVLRLEYQLAPGCNSGIYLRAPLEGRVSQIGLEIQLLDDKGWRGKLKGSQKNGSVYAGIAPEVDVPAPADQWNAIEILCHGKRIRTTLNGVQLYDAQLDDKKKDEKLLNNPLAKRRMSGYIGLQDHTGNPKFRNIRIRKLPPAPVAASKESPE